MAFLMSALNTILWRSKKNHHGQVVQSVELVKGHFVNCFSGFNTQYSDIFAAKNFSIFEYHSIKILPNR